MKSLLSLLAAISLFASPAAHASTIDNFTLTNNSDGSVLTFQLAEAPTTVIDDYGGFELDDVATSVGPCDFLFFDASNGGGLTADGSGLPYGPQLFSGTDANPMFLLGTFQLSDSPDLSTDDYTLSISQVAATPEPSSLLLLGTGALAAFGIIKRKLTV